MSHLNHSRVCLDPPIQYLFGSPSKSPNQKPYQAQKGTTLEGLGRISSVSKLHEMGASQKRMFWPGGPWRIWGLCSKEYPKGPRTQIVGF